MAVLLAPVPSKSRKQQQCRRRWRKGSRSRRPGDAKDPVTVQEEGSKKGKAAKQKPGSNLTFQKKKPSASGGKKAAAVQEEKKQEAQVEKACG